MIKVLSVASEAVPLVKTGGLADVVGALPGALAPHGIEVTTLLPGYRQVLEALSLPRANKRAKPPTPLYHWDSLLGEPAALYAGKLAGQPLLVLDCPTMFARAGGPYADINVRDWADNWRRFAILGRAAADLAGGAVKGETFDVLHAHDWQAASSLAYQRFAPWRGGGEGGSEGEEVRRIPGVITIHNMAFQGHFGAQIFGALGLPAQAWAMDGVEYHGGVSLLKAGLEAADAITTVSPTYAREIRDPAFGMGLEGLIVSRGARVRGLINGIDTEAWNPAHDSSLAAPYSVRSLSRRAANKRALEKEFALESDDGPLFIAVSRLTWQKGSDVLGECLDHLVGLGGRLALLGSGDAAIVNELYKAAGRHPGRITIRIGYDEVLSHRMQAGGDAILIPSRFEPCGLTQLYALAYGCVPVVTRTGGLADTVIDANLASLNAGVATGIVCERADYPNLAEAIRRAVSLYHDKSVWRSLQMNGMRADFSWVRCGEAYATLYRELVPGLGSPTEMKP